MKSSRSLLHAIALMSAVPLVCQADTVFSDNFSTSTMNSASPGAPTANSTDYAVLSTKNATGSSIGANDLKLTMPSTTSGFVQAQALFSSSPVVLANTGDYILLTATFTATAGIIGGPGTGSYLGFGLYNSGGTTPVTGGVLMNSGLNATAGSPYATGNAALWSGYAGRIRETTGASRLYTRPIQNGTGTASANQDLIFGGETGGFNNPAMTTLGSTYAWNSMLSQGNQYTSTLKLTLDSSTGFLTAEQNLYLGVGTIGTNLYSISRTSGSTSTPTLQFDGFAFGYRFAESVGAASTLDMNQITIESYIVPEPGSITLVGLGAAALLIVRRRNA